MYLDIFKICVTNYEIWGIPVIPILHVNLKLVHYYIYTYILSTKSIDYYTVLKNLIKTVWKNWVQVKNYRILVTHFKFYAAAKPLIML